MTRPVFITALAATCLFGTRTASALPMRTENFDTDPAWTVVGSGVNGNDFGYQSGSNNAGGDVGEGGGRFTRSTFETYYADTNIDGVLSLDEPLQASGKLDATSFQKPDFGTGLTIGHFDTPGNARVGITFTDNSTGFGGQLFWHATVALDDATIVGSGQVVPFTTNVDRTWSYTWEPSAGVNGGGLLTATLSGPGGGTQLVDLTPSERTMVSPMGAFGIRSNGAINAAPGERLDLFIDDLSYTVVPEPSTLALLAIGIVAFAVRRWRSRRVG